MVSNPVVEGVAGAVGAVISMTATYPLITVVTLRALDTQDDGAGGRRLPGALGLLPSAVQEVIHHSRDKGWRSLYAGLKPSVFATATSQGIYFYVYSALRGATVTAQVAAARRQQRARPGGGGGGGGGAAADASDAHSAAIGVGASLLVASAAGCINVMLTIPMWVVITQMQAAQKSRAPGGAAGNSGPAPGRDGGAWRTASRLYQERGVAGFYMGLRPSLVMVVNPTIQYVLYEWMAARLRALRRPAAAARGRKPRIGAADVFALSALAKVGATLATYPLLVIKNRLQSVNRHTEEGLRYTSVSDAVVRMWRSEGLAGFYRGMRVKLAQTVLAAALMMMLKEEVYEWTSAALLPPVAAVGGGKAGGVPAPARSGRAG
ncbi:MAG: mitochondrial carrier [Monoraphidium minutum]|nr:MAG: mitochondrial carrier [Monoraphidium minutum]